MGLLGRTPYRDTAASVGVSRNVFFETMINPSRIDMRVKFAVAVVVMVLSIAGGAAMCRAEDSRETDEGRAGADAASRTAEEQGGEKVLRHAVFFKFKDGTSDADIQKVVDAFDALPKKIDSIQGYERGKNVSTIGFDDGFTHCFLLSFADEAGRATYLPHPDHKAFGTTLGPHLDKAFVIDFWSTSEKSPKERQLKHALFLKFKDGASKAEIKDLEDSLAKLPSQIDTIKALEWGTNNSPETHDEGFTHAFLFTFDDAKGLKTYADAPEHKAVVEKIVSLAEKGRVLDFWTKHKE